MASKVPLLKFNNGKTIPQLGLGTWNVSKFFLQKYLLILRVCAKHR